MRKKKKIQKGKEQKKEQTHSNVMRLLKFVTQSEDELNGKMHLWFRSCIYWYLD